MGGGWCCKYCIEAMHYPGAVVIWGIHSSQSTEIRCSIICTCRVLWAIFSEICFSRWAIYRWVLLWIGHSMGSVWAHSNAIIVLWYGQVGCGEFKIWIGVGSGLCHSWLHPYGMVASLTVVNKLGTSSCRYIKWIVCQLPSSVVQYVKGCKNLGGRTGNQICSAGWLFGQRDSSKTCQCQIKGLGVLCQVVVHPWPTENSSWEVNLVWVPCCQKNSALKCYLSVV